MHMITYEIAYNKHTLFSPSTPPTFYALLFANLFASLPGDRTGQGSSSLHVVIVGCRPGPKLLLRRHVKRELHFNILF